MELKLLNAEETKEYLNKIFDDRAEQSSKAKLEAQIKQRLKTRVEAAKYVHLSPNSFDEVVRPHIKVVKFEGFSRLMWDVRDLDQFIQERKIGNDC